MGPLGHKERLEKELAYLKATIEGKGGWKDLVRGLREENERLKVSSAHYEMECFRYKDLKARCLKEKD